MAGIRRVVDNMCLRLGATIEQDRLPFQVVAVDSRVLAARETSVAADMLKRDMWARLAAINDRETQAWENVQSRRDWERFRDARLQALRQSLGTPPTTPLEVEVTHIVPGDGFRIECLVISGRPGLPITANLYLPDPPRDAMPGIVICTSHHNPKTEGELQDMGMTWARSGAMVLVPDNLGHGERRQQPFAGREDYRWRYNEGIQLYLVGESLVGWMVADLRRCLDVVLSRPGIDPKRIVLIGSVAGGGEQSAIASALDSRVTCAIPFNFGSGYTVNESEMAAYAGTYNWANWGDWESTRVLRLSGRDGFLPWMIVAAGAPRPLIFAKEFAFEAEKDPAWQRIRQVYEFYDAASRVAEVHGYGNGSLPPSAASHANNVGPPHRKGIYPLLAQWLNMPVPQEYRKRLDPSSLACMTPQAESEFGVKTMHEVVTRIANQRLAEARRQLVDLAPADRRQNLRQSWGQLLGDTEPKAAPAAKAVPTTQPAAVTVEKVLLTVEKDVLVPIVLLSPPQAKTPASQPRQAMDSASQPTRRPVVICIAQQGKGAFLVKRADEIAALLRQGCVVCLPDVRGTGETSPGPDRDYAASVTEIHSQELKMGRTLLGSRLRDLRSVMGYLRTRDDIDPARMALWGESFAPANPEAFVDPPLKTDVLAILCRAAGSDAGDPGCAV